MKNVNFDLNAMGVEEMTEKEVLSVDGGEYVVNGITFASENLARDYAEKIGYEVIDDLTIVWP